MNALTGRGRPAGLSEADLSLQANQSNLNGMAASPQKRPFSLSLIRNAGSLSEHRLQPCAASCRQPQHAEPSRDLHGQVASSADRCGSAQFSQWDFLDLPEMIVGCRDAVLMPYSRGFFVRPVKAST